MKCNRVHENVIKNSRTEGAGFYFVTSTKWFDVLLQTSTVAGLAPVFCKGIAEFPHISFPPFPCSCGRNFLRRLHNANTVQRFFLKKARQRSEDMAGVVNLLNPLLRSCLLFYRRCSVSSCACQLRSQSCRSCAHAISGSTWNSWPFSRRNATIFRDSGVCQPERKSSSRNR